MLMQKYKFLIQILTSELKNLTFITMSQAMLLDKLIIETTPIYGLLLLFDYGGGEGRPSVTLFDRGGGSAERYVTPKIIHMYNIIL